MSYRLPVVLAVPANLIYSRCRNDLQEHSSVRIAAQNRENYRAGSVCG
ncbi:hypothetical protein [Agrobacterium sp.]|nr:hypothetical protein [Agrobacterium sp.]